MDTSNWYYYPPEYINNYSDSRYNTEICLDGFYDPNKKIDVETKIEKDSIKEEISE